MKRVTTALGIVLAILAATPLYAQQATAPADQHHQDAPAAGKTPSGPPSGAAAGGMMPMEMCRQMMMGGPQMMMMGGPMMGGMTGMPMGMPPHEMDPEMMAEMMEIHGEMMKAMGDIIIKHAQKMRGMTR